MKILGEGELTKKLTVSAHGFSKTAREKIEAVGGTAALLREPKLKKRKRGKKAPARPAETEADVETPATDVAESAEAADEAADAAESKAEQE